jgi:hypothetical protein
MPFDEWTWQLVPAGVEDQTTGEASGLTTIEVVVRNTNSAGVYRLAQMHKVVTSVVTNAAASEVAP